MARTEALTHGLDVPTGAHAHYDAYDRYGERERAAHDLRETREGQYVVTYCETCLQTIAVRHYGIRCAERDMTPYDAARERHRRKTARENMYARGYAH
jgi:hypothetical protein